MTEEKKIKVTRAQIADEPVLLLHGLIWKHHPPSFSASIHGVKNSKFQPVSGPHDIHMWEKSIGQFGNWLALFVNLNRWQLSCPSCPIHSSLTIAWLAMSWHTHCVPPGPQPHSCTVSSSDHIGRHSQPCLSCSLLERTPLTPTLPSPFILPCLVSSTCSLKLPRTLHPSKTSDLSTCISAPAFAITFTTV